jgi:acyl-CoA synthetase (AMP-forming)/AMP-acid ligase II
MYGGFVPVPLNVTSGRSALAYALAHSEARVLFADAEWQPLAESVARGVDHPIRVLSVAADDPAGGEEPEAGEDALASSEASNDALLIYTSGSTGRPKGVLFTQRSILACGWNAVRAHKLGCDDRFLCVLPLYHMNSVDKLLGVLSSGGSIVLPRRFDLSAYWSWVAQHRCTWLALVPTVVSQLTSRPRPEAVSLESVRFARSSSAALGEEQRRAFEEKFGIPCSRAWE